MNTAFDTLTASNNLQKTGIEKSQADAIALVVNNSHGELVTKTDLAAVKTDLAAAMNEQKAELTTAMNEQKAELTAAMSEQKAELTTAMNEQKAELTAAMSEQKTELTTAMNEQKAELTAAMNELKTELTAAMAELVVAISGQNNKIEKLNTDIKWVKIIGGTISTMLILPYIANFLGG
ncbi:MAG: hypothetical protein OXD01_08865 [Gammaproteobacteria bacterium]|nr:hypothetical protein [Gammaproteobacteria bacterium]